MEDKKFYTIQEAAEILGYNVQTIYDQRAKGRGVGPKFKKRGPKKRLYLSEFQLKRALAGAI
jgi:hypothetical protein